MPVYNHNILTKNTAQLVAGNGMGIRYTVYSSRAILSMFQKAGICQIHAPWRLGDDFRRKKVMGVELREDHDPSPWGSNLSEDIGLYNHRRNARYLYRFHSHFGSRGVRYREVDHCLTFLLDQPT